MPDDIQKIFGNLGIDMATLHRVAGLVKDNPEVQKLFKEQLKDKGFDQSVEELYEELNEVLNHGKSPRA